MFDDKENKSFLTVLLFVLILPIITMMPLVNKDKAKRKSKWRDFLFLLVVLILGFCLYYFTKTFLINELKGIGIEHQIVK